MIISPARKYVFVHIPKTGGTALSLALEDRAHKDDILIGDTPKAIKRRRRLKDLQARGRLWKHSTMADIDGVLGPEVMEDIMVVALVRNPWDRMVSYYHWLRMQDFDHPAVKIAHSATFADFTAHPMVRESMKRNPYGSYVRNPNGEEYPALFARLEHFAADIVPLENHLGFKLALPRANTSERESDFRGYYNDHTAALVAEVCAEDIARFGYSFDDVSVRPE